MVAMWQAVLFAIGLGGGPGGHADGADLRRAEERATAVAVFPLAAEGGIADADRARLQSALVGGLDALGYEVVPPSRTRKLMGRCEPRICEGERLRSSDARYVVHARIKGRARMYALGLSLWSVGGGEPLVSIERSCDVCGQRELRSLLVASVGALTHDIPRDPVSDAQLRIASSPSRALVIVDGRTIGRTPVETNIEAGPHEVRLSKVGYRETRIAVSPTPEQPERVHADLSRSPIREWKRPVGAVSLATGLASTLAGAVLLGIDGREHRRRCADEERDGFGDDDDCRHVYRTRGAGIGLTVSGLALSGAGITLLVLSERTGKTHPVRATLSRRGVRVSVRF